MMKDNNVILLRDTFDVTRPIYLIVDTFLLKTFLKSGSSGMKDNTIRFAYLALNCVFGSFREIHRTSFNKKGGLKYLNG